MKMIVLYVYDNLDNRFIFLSQCEIWKRYSDFQHLSKQLESIHSQSRQVTPFPSIVKAKYFGKQIDLLTIFD